MKNYSSKLTRSNNLKRWRKPIVSALSLHKTCAREGGSANDATLGTGFSQ